MSPENLSWFVPTAATVSISLVGWIGLHMRASRQETYLRGVDAQRTVQAKEATERLHARVDALEKIPEDIEEIRKILIAEGIILLPDTQSGRDGRGVRLRRPIQD